MENNLIPFGKYKGQPVEVLASDKQYMDWIMAQPWLKEKFGNVYNVIVNNFKESDETPEHNKMQIKFLKPEHMVKLAYLIYPKLFSIKNSQINSYLKEEFKKVPYGYELSFIEEAKKMDGTRLTSFDEIVFESIDVQYSIEYGLSFSHKCGYGQTNRFGLKNWIKCFIEIKPTVGDDFPAILRQMKTSMPTKHGWDKRYPYILLIGEYTGVGATQEEFILFFRTQGYRVIFEYQIEQLQLPEIERVFCLDPDVIKPLEEQAIVVQDVIRKAAEEAAAAQEKWNKECSERRQKTISAK